MKTKTVVTAIVLAFVAVSIGYLVFKEVRDRSIEQTKHSQSGERHYEGPDRVLAYYFHGTARCHTCRRIEAYSQEALESGFPAELKSGRLEWHVLNVEEPQNAHFVKDYKLATKSLILVDVKNGKENRWKNLEYVWEHVGNKDEFLKYVQNEAEEYIGNKN